MRDEIGAGSLLTILRLWLAIGLGLALAGSVAVATILLPGVVEDTTARIWIAIGLFGLAIAGLAAIGVYALKAIGEDRLAGWLAAPSPSEEVSHGPAEAHADEEQATSPRLSL